MSPFFDNLEDQLRAAARSRTGADEAAADDPGAQQRPRRGPAWLRAGLRATPVLIAVGTTIAVAVAALLLLGHQQRPSQSAAGATGHSTLQQIIRSTPRSVLQREGSYLEAATRQVQRTHPGLCGAGLAAHRPSLIHGTPSQALLSVLGVLRRPAGPADLSGTRQFSGVPQIYAGSIRRAFAADGVSYYIAAARNDPAAYQPSPRCFALQVAALHADLSRIPAALQAQTLRLQSAFIALDRKLIASGPSQVICTASVSRNGGGSECGFGAAQIAAGIEPSDDNGTFSGIAPDGVATVTVFWRAPHGGKHSATASVTGNMYAVRAGGAFDMVVKVVWRSAQGQVIKTISPPSSRALARLCHQHPVPCAAVSAATAEVTGSSSTATPAPLSSSESSSSSSSSATGTMTQASSQSPAGTMTQASSQSSAGGG